MTNTVQVFPVKAPPMLSAVLICVSVMVLLLGSFLVLRKVAPEMAMFHSAFYIIVIGILATAVFSTRKTRYEVSAEGLRIRGDWMGRLLRWEDIETSETRLVNFNSNPELKPQWRTCGTCLPGYSSGWFRLKNKSKALVFLTDKNDAVYLPTRKGFCVMLSSEDNAALLRSIQQWAKDKRETNREVL